MATIQESKENELQKALREEMEHFYDQCRQLFVGIPNESTANESDEGESLKQDETMPNSSFYLRPLRLSVSAN